MLVMTLRSIAVLTTLSHEFTLPFFLYTREKYLTEKNIFRSTCGFISPTNQEKRKLFNNYFFQQNLFRSVEGYYEKRSVEYYDEDLS